MEDYFSRAEGCDNEVSDVEQKELKEYFIEFLTKKPGEAYHICEIAIDEGIDFSIHRYSIDAWDEISVEELEEDWKKARPKEFVLGEDLKL